MDVQTQTHTQAHVGRDRNDHLLVWIAYACYASVVLMPIGALISLYEWRRDRNMALLPYQPRLFAVAHHRWLGRTFVLGFIATMAAAGHFYYGIGILTLLVTMVWYGYRVVRGVIALVKREPPPLAELTPPRTVTSVKYTYQ